MIQYGPGGLEAATRRAAPSGPLTYTEVQGLNGQTVTSS